MIYRQSRRSSFVANDNVICRVSAWCYMCSYAGLCHSTAPLFSRYETESSPADLGYRILWAKVSVYNLINLSILTYQNIPHRLLCWYGIVGTKNFVCLNFSLTNCDSGYVFLIHENWKINNVTGQRIVMLNSVIEMHNIKTTKLILKRKTIKYFLQD